MVTDLVKTCMPITRNEDSLTFNEIILMPSDIGFSHRFLKAQLKRRATSILTKRQGCTERISARGLDSADRAQRFVYQRNTLARVSLNKVPRNLVK